jgi:hypothetical protein
MPAVSERDTIPPPETLRECAQLLYSRFVQQPNLYSVQQADGRYICVRRFLTVGLIQRHLEGKITLGTYVLNKDSKTKYLVLDADTDEVWSNLVNMAHDLKRKGIPSYLETSRRGGHVWMFFQNPMSARYARAFAQDLIWTYSLPTIEIFPKQDRLADGPGSLIRLPFGMHQVVGRRFGFISPDGTPLAPRIREQITTLAHAATIPEYAFEVVERPKRVREQAQREIIIYEANETVSTLIKRKVSVLEFVSQFVDLSAKGKGMCPFHKDRIPSFSVDDAKNYWHCFAGCGGGSVIDFWMKWRMCDFKTAVKELAYMIL